MNATATHHDQSRRVLVIANETCTGEELHELIAERAGASSDGTSHAVMIVAPALNSRLRHLFSDVDPAIRDAELRVSDCVERLRRRGVEAIGVVGDEDPLRAIEDTLHTFPADELIVSTHTPERSNWMARDLVPRAIERFSLPTSHVEVDVTGQAAAVYAAAA
jgi:GABA permease